ncbi:MAG: proline dehydrogenase family protein [Flavobacteriales bacterium]|nr:proline dehydrogenase family protein [Flavobacteriales bacterium]
MPINFNNTEFAYKNRSNKELNKASFIFKVMNNPNTVKLLTKLTLLAYKLHLPIDWIVRSTIFQQFCGGENMQECDTTLNRMSKSGIGAILDYSVEGNHDEESFENVKKELIKIILKAKNNLSIPYSCLKITGIARFELLEKINAHTPLTAEEQTEFENLKKRFYEICETAYVNNVPIFIDAEESWIQKAIDELTEHLMEQFNKNRAIISTTLQMYRNDKIEHLNNLITRARENKFFLGVKLVRGAYWEKENEYAKQKNIPSVVHQTKEATDACFNQAVEICLNNIETVVLCAGTHNEESTLHLIKLMSDKKIPNNHPNVYFSQLYGMSDHISYTLAGEGYNVTKYLPYGPIKSVIPYLIRRAEENTSIKGQASRELQLLIKEKQRRKEQKLLK